MIITDTFVFLHYPKTGGLFVADVLKKVEPACRELLTPNLKRIRGSGVFNPHGTYEQIPEADRGKPVVSCIRNPFDRYVSTFEYRQWTKGYPPEEMDLIRADYPRFPDLTFSEYLPFVNKFDIRSRTDHDLLKADIGFITFAFIQFFFRRPHDVFLKLTEDYLDPSVCRGDMAEIEFLRTESLNSGLYRLLRKYGYPEERVSFVRDAGKINATSARDGGKDWPKYYDRARLEYVAYKERFLFKLFPEYRPAP
jgi:hypothetical protein